MRTLSQMLCAVLVALPALSEVGWAQQHVVVVLDDSGSMGDRMRTRQGRQRRIDVAKTALTKVLSELPAETQVGVVALNSTVGDSHWIVPFGTGNRGTWQANIARIQDQGGTPLGEFMKVGADRLLEAREESRYGSYRLLIVTDGEASDEGLVESYLPDILSRGLILDVIGVDMQADHSLATRVHSYRRADDDSSLQQAISEVFAESSSDDQDAADGFEMLAALPDEFADRALQTLASRGNGPIEEVAPLATAVGGGSTSGPFGTPGSSSTIRSSGGGGSGAAAATFSSLFCCLFGLMFSVVVVSLILAGRKRGRR